MKKINPSAIFVFGQMILFFLKCFYIISWSWLIVLAPILVIISAFGFVMIILGLIMTVEMLRSM